MESQLERLFGFRGPAGEAVHDAAKGQAVLADDGQRVVPSLARMDDDGLSRAECDFELPAENVALHITGRKIVDNRGRSRRWPVLWDAARARAAGRTFRAWISPH